MNEQNVSNMDAAATAKENVVPTIEYSVNDSAANSESKETTEVTVEQQNVEALANGIVARLRCGAVKPEQRDLDLFRELLIWTIERNDLNSVVDPYNTSVVDAKLPGPIVDWFNHLRGVYVYGETSSMNLRYGNGPILLRRRFNDYRLAFDAIFNCVNKKSKFECDKPLIDNSIGFFASDMSYFDVTRGVAVLKPDNVGKLLPVLKVDGCIMYRGGNLTNLDSYASDAADALVNIMKGM